MDYSRVPMQYLKADCLAPEAEYASKNLECRIRKATATDIARIEAEIAAKKPTITVDIMGEINRARKPEKKPDYPFEFVPKKEPQYNPVKFDERVAG